jgi:hypothetical protein
MELDPYQSNDSYHFKDIHIINQDDVISSKLIQMLRMMQHKINLVYFKLI